MRQRFSQFMVGRNGNDQLNMFLLVVDVVLMLLSGIIGGKAGKIMHILVILLLLYAYFRMFSKNLTRRREENGKYMRLRYKVSAEFKIRRERWVQRKDYKFFICPNCKTNLRVPRGHGKIKVLCRKCGNSFIGKS